MSLEKQFVAGHMLGTGNRSRFDIHFFNGIDHQHRISVRDNVFDLFYVQLHEMLLTQ